MILTYSLMFVVGGAVAVGLTWYSQKAYDSSANLLRNGGFESGMEHWGTGNLEDRVRNGNFPQETAVLPYVVAPSPAATDSRGQLDASVARSGHASYRFVHRTQKAPGCWGSLAQRVTGLKRHRYYLLTVWAKAAHTAPNADPFFVATDLQWSDARKLKLLPSGEWTQYVHTFNTGEFDYVEIRFVIEEPGTFWIDDVSLRELSDG